MKKFGWLLLVVSAVQAGELTYGTYLSSVGINRGLDVTADRQGTLYLAGTGKQGHAVVKLSPQLDLIESFPVEEGTRRIKTDNQGNLYVAAWREVVKLNPSGGVEYHVSINGGGMEEGINDIAVDLWGNLIVAGTTDSRNFPVVNAAQPEIGDPRPEQFLAAVDAYVVKLNPQGEMVYSTYLGGEGPEWSRGVSVDSRGNAYVVGTTGTNPWDENPFPTTRNAFGSSGRGFITKFNPQGRIIYSTRIPGSLGIAGIAVGSHGQMTVVGEAGPGLPLRFPVQGRHGGGWDLFVMKLTPAGNRLMYSTYLGGSGEERATGIASNARGDTVITGGTYSPNFPLRFPVQPRQDIGAVVALFNPQGRLIYSTMIGTDIRGVYLDGQSNTSITGNGTIPTTEDALQGELEPEGWTGFFARIAPNTHAVVPWRR